jgi:hypothetical protein
VARKTEKRFAALSDFMSGYLHQDFQLEHDTPAAAYRAYVADAGGREIAALKRDSRQFLDWSAKQSWPAMRDAFADLGGAWRPSSRTALERFLAAMIDAKARG